MSDEITNGILKVGDKEIKVEDFKIYIENKVEELSSELKYQLNNFSYSPFTEYVRPPEHANCKCSTDNNFIDSTAIVIDPDVLALSAPGQKVVEE